MTNADNPLSVVEVHHAKTRRLQMQHLNAIESNPLDATDIAMFEMFEREGWSHERRRAYIRAKFVSPSSNTASAAE